MIRYELREGKFGYYFYDKEVKLDLSLKMVLNKLNYCNNLKIKQVDLNQKLSVELSRLKIEYRKLLLQGVI